MCNFISFQNTNEFVIVTAQPQPQPNSTSTQVGVDNVISWSTQPRHNLND